MKKLILPCIFIMNCLPGYNQTSNGPKELEFSNKDRQIWTDYEDKSILLSKEIRNTPEKKDSLIKIGEKLLNETYNKAIRLAIEYANTNQGLMSLYRLRNMIEKDTLQVTFDKLSSDLLENPYAKSILLHIKLNQAKEGGKYIDFQATKLNGESFNLASLVQKKDILLIFDGLDCMGESNRDTLISLYEKIDKSNFEMVSYIYQTNKEGFGAYCMKYKIPWLCITDFMDDHSYAKISYGVQAKPTSFFIKKGGLIELACLGVEDTFSILNTLIK